MNSKNIDYKQKYKELKVKLKSLIYENETYHEQLKRSQDEYLQVTNDRDYLLNRLLAYEHVSDDSTDCSDESDTEVEKIATRNELNSAKKKKASEPKKRSAVKLSAKKGRPVSCAQSQKLDQQKSAVKPAKSGQTATLKTSQKATAESQQRNQKNQATSKPVKETKKTFDHLPALAGNQFVHSPASRTASIGNLVSGTLNDYQQEFDREQDKLMFADDQKLLFGNELNGNLNMLPDSRDADIDSMNLELNLDNLHANLTAGSLTPGLTGNEIDDALAHNLNGALNSNLNALNENNLRGGDLSDGLNCLNTPGSGLHASDLDGNLNFESINFESQSSQSLLIKQ